MDPETPAPEVAPSSRAVDVEKRVARMLANKRVAHGLAFGSAVLIGSTLSLLWLPSVTGDRIDPGPAPLLEFLGAPLALERGAIDEALERVRKFSERSLTIILPDQRAEVVPLAKLGIEIDTARLGKLIQDARDPTSPLRLHLRDVARGDARVETDATGVDRSHILPVPVRVDVDNALSILLRLKDEIDRGPEDARLDLQKKSVLPDRAGRTVDVDKTLAHIDEALNRGELRVSLVVHEQPAAQRANALAGLSFDHVLGHFETRYNRAAKAEDRTYNLRLAASKLDGTVLLPGAVFDFNAVVGPRDEAHGYKVATVIADGELVDGIGGGTCQISGTLHGAAFFAGLEIVERYPHTRPSSYIKMGLDATVVYPTINFRLRNPYDFPIVLHEVVQNGVVRAEVWGPRLDQVATLIRRIDEAIPYEELERPDPSLPRGLRVLSQRGIAGFRLHRYRVLRQGNHTVRERWKDVYPPTAQIIRVGTGPSGLEGRTSDDSTPEYLADELLIVTQRRNEDGEPGEFAENRERGRFGEAGWTGRAGMPLWGG